MIPLFGDIPKFLSQSDHHSPQAKSWAGHAAYRQPPSWEKPRAGERGKKKINGKSTVSTEIEVS